jgi:hypothetical protein
MPKTFCMKYFTMTKKKCNNLFDSFLVEWIGEIILVLTSLQVHATLRAISKSILNLTKKILRL